MSVATLTSNGLPLPHTSRYTGPLTATPLSAIADGSAAARLRESGYLLFRGLLPRAQVLNLRERYFRLFPSSFVQDGDYRRAAYAGVLPRALPAYGTCGHPAYQLVRQAEFTQFAEHPILQDTAARVLEAPVERLRRTPIRHFVPGQHLSSRAHIDRSYVESSPNDIVTFWVPLGDCPIAGGGLVYLEGSHHEQDIAEKVLPLAPFDRPDDRRPLTHDLKWMAEYTGRRWLLADFAAGDVVIHSPMIVHASLDLTVDEMRLSTDIRYLRAGTHYDPRWRTDWAANDSY